MVRNAKREALQKKFKAPKQIVMEELKKHENIKGPEIPADNVTRIVRYQRALTLLPNPDKKDPFFTDNFLKSESG